MMTRSLSSSTGAAISSSFSSSCLAVHTHRNFKQDSQDLDTIYSQLLDKCQAVLSCRPGHAWSRLSLVKAFLLENDDYIANAQLRLRENRGFSLILLA